jgi:hypothetical protein
MEPKGEGQKGPYVVFQGHWSIRFIIVSTLYTHSFDGWTGSLRQDTLDLFIRDKWRLVVNPLANTGRFFPTLFRGEVIFPPGEGATLLRANIVDLTLGVFEKDAIVLVALHLYEGEPSIALTKIAPRELLNRKVEVVSNSTNFIGGYPDISWASCATLSASRAPKTQAVFVPGLSMAHFLLKPLRW